MLVGGALNGSSRWGAAILVLIAVTSGRVGAATTSDGADSIEETPSPVIGQFPQCENETIGGAWALMGDSYCDTHSNNVAECGFDGGDCCECTCVDIGKEYSCRDFECKDTEAECYVEPSPTPSPLTTLDSSAMPQRVLSPALALAYGACLIGLAAVAW